MSPPSTRSILLVEDNPMDVDLMRRVFMRRKVANPLDVARDGEEALSCLARWESGEPTPILVLMDLQLPKLSGLEVLRQIRATQRGRTVPVVMLTTSAEDRDIQSAYELGANSYIVKPVDFEKFLSVVEQIETYWGRLNTPAR